MVRILRKQEPKRQKMKAGTVLPFMGAVLLLIVLCISEVTNQKAAEATSHSPDPMATYKQGPIDSLVTASSDTTVRSEEQN
jgi:hypothetical protein